MNAECCMVMDSVDYLMPRELNYRLIGGWISHERHKRRRSNYTRLCSSVKDSFSIVEGHRHSMWEVDYVLNPVRTNLTHIA